MRRAVSVDSMAVQPDGKLEISFDTTFFEAVRDSGLCKDPEHAVLDGNIMAGIGRHVLEQ